MFICIRVPESVVPSGPEPCKYKTPKYTSLGRRVATVRKDKGGDRGSLCLKAAIRVLMGRAIGEPVTDEAS